MTDLETLFKKLDKIEQIHGQTGLYLGIFCLISLFLIWIYLKKSVENQVKISFEKELADYNKNIQKELAEINSEIGLLLNRKIGNADQEREAILSYLNAYSYLLYGSLEFDILSFKYNNQEDINSTLKQIRKAYSECNQSWNKLKFWTTKEDIVHSSHELNKILLKYGKLHQLTLSELRSNLSWRKLYSDQLQTHLEKNGNLKEWTEFLALQDQRILEENKRLIEKFWEEREILFAEVVKRNEEFQVITRQYLDHE